MSWVVIASTQEFNNLSYMIYVLFLVRYSIRHFTCPQCPVCSPLTKLSVLANRRGAEMSVKCRQTDRNSAWKINFPGATEALKVWPQRKDETHLLIPLWHFSDRYNPILAVTTGEHMRIPGSTPTLSVKYRKCSHAKKAVHTKSSRLWMSEEIFHTELSRITFYDYIIYPKL